MPTQDRCVSLFAKLLSSRDVQSEALNLLCLVAKKDCLLFIEGFPVDANFNVVTCEEGFVISFEDIPGDHVYIVDIFGKRLAYFVEGTSEVEHCNVVNEKDDGIIIKDIGVEGVKGMSFFDSSK